MIRLVDLLKETLSSNDTYELDKSIAAANKAVKKFFDDNEQEIEKLIASQDFIKLYHMAVKDIKGIEPYKLLQALNNKLVSITSHEPTVGKPKDNESFEIDDTSTTWEVSHEVSKWVKRNREKLVKLADKDDYKEFYGLAKKEFPKAQEWKLVLAVSAAAIEHDIHYEYDPD